MSRTRKNTARKSRSTTSDALEIIDKVIVGGDSELREQIEAATLNARVASIIYDARKAAGLTQAELARLVGTRQSVISQLEDSAYEGHSLTMLHRIAKALGGHVDVRLVFDRPGPVTSGQTVA